MKNNKKTDTGHASSGKYTELAVARQKRVRMFCAKRNIYKQDFVRLAGVSLSTIYRYLRGESVYFSYRIEAVLKGKANE